LGLEWASGLFQQFWQPAALSASMTALVAFMLIFGAQANWNAVNPDTILADQADLAALEWIDAHTPPDARFFINTTPWGYDLYRGVDGGGWILPTTGRWSLVPTIFYTFSAGQESIENWTDWASRASKLITCGTDFWELVEEADLSYIYIRQGPTGLQAQNLTACEGLRKLYENEGVSIWLIDGYNPEESPESNEG